MASLTQDDLIRTLLSQRTRLTAGVWLVVRDLHIAEDLFQEVMIRALENRELFTDETQLLSWCRVAARNSAINVLRKRQREATMLSEQIIDLLDREWDEESRTPPARIEALHECLEALPEKSRALLDLRYFQGHSCSEVGKALGMSLDAAYQRLSRLHRALRTCVDEKLSRSLTPVEQFE